MCLFSSICKVNSKTQFSSIVACSISVLLWWTSSSADDRILNSWSSGKLCWMAELEEFFFLVEQCFSSRNYSRRSMRSNLGITSRGEEDTYFSSCSIWKCSPLKKTNQQVFFFSSLRSHFLSCWKFSHLSMNTAILPSQYLLNHILQKCVEKPSKVWSQASKKKSADFPFRGLLQDSFQVSLFSHDLLSLMAPSPMQNSRIKLK